MTSTLSPKASGFRMPAEWEYHNSVWLAWPSAKNLWQEDLPEAQDEFVAFCEAIADVDKATGTVKGERLNVLVPTIHAGAEAEQRLKHLPARIHLIPFGDIWLRDTAPLFLTRANGKRAMIRFQFNGWGGKFDLPYDKDVAKKIVEEVNLPEFVQDWICEGGSLEVDGDGTCLTTRQCLLNKNRNPHLTEAEIETRIKETLNVRKVLWLNEGLINDHTDGHIDTIARFVAPGEVVVMEARDQDDPNREILNRIITELKGMTDAEGRKLKVIKVPSPGAILNYDDELMPASYLNFYIANSTVVVPTYGSKWDKIAVDEIARCFPARKTVGLPAKAILTGGGAFHCISQQEPS